MSGILAGGTRRAGEERWRAAREKRIKFRTPDGATRYVGLSVSPLRLTQNQTSGYVLSVQDLTELKRLEREVVTKERMAALGRLSAAIAHEIRQPLTAMTGALKELARLAPLEDDDKKLVHIVSRESQRLDRMNYRFSQLFSGKDLFLYRRRYRGRDRRNPHLNERDASALGKFRIGRELPLAIFARARIVTP